MPNGNYDKIIDDCIKETRNITINLVVRLIDHKIHSWNHEAHNYSSMGLTISKNSCEEKAIVLLRLKEDILKINNDMNKELDQDAKS